MFFYTSHLDGSVYSSEKQLDEEELYCFICGDYDWFEGEYDSIEELLKDKPYLKDCLKDNKVEE